MIKSLNIERFKGFPIGGPKIKNLENGLNIVYGENGAGKTTICKAIKTTLWPEYFKDSTARVESTWKNNNKEEVFASLQDNSVNWTKDNKIGIPAEFSSCFVVSTDSFEISKESTDKNISELISKELSGGINFQKLREIPELEFSPRKLKNLKDELNKASQKRKEIESNIISLKSDEASLPIIRKKIFEEKELKKDEVLVNNLIRKNELLKLISDYEREISDLNSGALVMKDDDVENIEKFEKKIRELTNKIGEKKDELNNLTIEKNLLSKEKILTKEELEDFEVIKIEIEKLEKQLDGIRQDEKNIKNKKDGYIETLSSQEIYYKIRSYDKNRIEKLNDFLEEYKKLNERKVDFKKALDLISINNDDSLNKLRKEFTTIKNLLSLNTINLIAESIFTLMAILLVASLKYYPQTKIITLIFTTIAFLVVLFFQYKSYKKRQEFDNSDYNINLKSRNAIKTLLEELGEKRNIYLQKKFDKDKYYSIQQKITEVDEEISKLKASNVAYYNQSLEAIIDIPSIMTLWNNIKKNEINLLDLKEESKNLISKQDVLFEKIKPFLQDNFENDLVFINRQLSKERARREDFNLLLTKIEFTEKEITNLQNNLNEYNTNKNEIFLRIGINTEDRNLIYKIKEDRGTYLDLKEQLVIANHELKNLEAKLINNDKFNELTNLELENKKTEILSGLKDLDGIDKKEVEITTKIESFKKNNSFQEAKKDEDKKHSNLSDFINNSLINLAGSSILNFVENEYKKEKEPEILIEANNLFSLFTNGKYSLKFNDSNEFGFFALDEENSKAYSINELSMGTKAQLILALRTSYVLSFSKNKDIPLLIDEVLATTDDLRFDAIMNSFFKLTQNGYQIIYFTSQKSVISKIKKLAEEKNISIYIKNISTNELNLDKNYYDDVRINDIPNLLNINQKERLKILNIPPLSLPLKSESIHIAFLEKDPAILTNLLKLGVTSFGKLKNLYNKVANKDFVLSKNEMNKISLKAQAFDIYSELWSIGRGEKFSAELLNESATDTFKTKLYEIADDTSWMSSDFMKAISPDGPNKIARFKQQYDKLKEIFERDSLIDYREPLSKEDLRSEFITRLLKLNPNIDKNEAFHFIDFVDTVLN